MSVEPADENVALERLLSVTELAIERQAQLQRALESRVLIEQAKGILAERYGLGIEEAFELLRDASRRNRMKLRDLAERVVVESPTSPREIEAAHARFANR